ncbi:hypothetical protein VNO78_11981 [Psophocarpus tetragonolobus]|uniref:Uncharacterized protein n=1 Tax=Psophocarpus tetragonolobus TaxID=3891 RepID=A0AAN9SV35_PSOTE
MDSVLLFNLLHTTHYICSLVKGGSGEVDDELEDEVGSECAKYGTFERSKETTKALIDLDGRYFGGRVVRASFYDEKFSKNELAPTPGEVPGFS